MTDTLSNIIKKQECGIINMDSDSGLGSGVVAYLKSLNEIVYFDSYGNLPSPIEIIRLFKSDGSNTHLTYN